MVCRIALLTPEELPLGQGGIIDRLGCPIAPLQHCFKALNILEVSRRI